jgi:carbonic anhydrase
MRTSSATLKGRPVAATAARAAPVLRRAPLAVKCEAEKKSNLVNMSRRQTLLAGGAAASAFGACPCPTCGPAPALASEWSYGEMSGPREWGGVCSGSVIQSPIDIDPRVADFKPAKDTFSFAFEQYPKNVVNSGHGVQVNFNPGSYTYFGDQKYELLQFHFHTPSEHTYKGKHASMEAHLVHKNVSTGSLAVLGALMVAKPGVAPNRALQTALDLAPETPGEAYDSTTTLSRFTLDPVQLLPRKLGYWNYPGSLTTPPCSEGVNWFVFGDTVFISPDQVLQFQEILGEAKTLSLNSRPPLSLAGRQLTGYIV